MNEEEFLEIFFKSLDEEIEDKSYLNKLKKLIESEKITETNYKKLIQKEFE
ncbi:hypothetical protein [uncultured Methanobrevibacter sp.]|uniref:hypothetical protein n=1 Tax=uncultured Methanobrevibacter sp. TaxID=253161 RepID=UPI00260E5DAD